MERMSENLFKFDLGSPSNGRKKQEGYLRLFYELEGQEISREYLKRNFRDFLKRNVASKKQQNCTAKLLYKMSISKSPDQSIAVLYPSTSTYVNKEIKSKVGRIKRRIEAKTNVISFQKLNEFVSPIFHSLNDLETRITKQINQAAWNHNCRLKNMEWALQEQLLQEIKLLAHQDGDIQSQRLKDIHSDIMAIKSTMKAMTREKYNCCSCFSREKECVRYFVEEPTSAKNNFSEKHREHENGKETSEEVKDSVKYDKDTKVPTNEDFHETLLQEHQFDDLQQVPCSIDPCHSHKMDENIVVDIENNPCSLRKGHEAGDQQMGKEGENAEIIKPDKYCNDSANIPVCNACPVEINIQNELHSLQEACEAGEPEVGNGKENASIDMPHIDCNDGADIQDNLSQKDKVEDNCCPSNGQRRNIILRTKLKKFDICMPAQEQESTKRENGNNCGTECKLEVSPKIIRSNLLSETVSRSKNKAKYDKQGTLSNRMGSKLSSSLGNSNKCDLVDLPQTNGGMDQFDKGNTNEQNLEERYPKNIPGNRFSDCVPNKDVSLNSNDHEKQISNKVDNTNAFGEQQTSMKKRKSPPDPKQMATNGKHHPAKKAVISEAAWLRRPSHRFHESEVECLIAAVENFGTGRWKDVKEKYFSTFQFRTASDLKDKWRSLLHSAANLADNHKFRATVSVNLLKRVLAVHEKV